MEILITAFYIILCVLLFALAILIHEFGHFIVALKLGLRVEAFSIGFGPALWKKKMNGVEYRISAIPLGGYVSIPDVDPEGTKALEGARDGGEEHQAHDDKRVQIPAWKEILVAVAGPLMNVVLAVVIAVVLASVPGVRFGETSTRVVQVLPDSPAEKAGIQVGDRIVAVRGHAVETLSEMQTEIQIASDTETEFLVERGSQTNCVLIAVARDEITEGCYIGAVMTNESGAVSWMPARNPLKQLAWDAGSIFRVLKGLVNPEEAKATSRALGGPVMIAEGLYRQVRRDPWDGLGFLRFLNVNLAVLNLLPIPVLDGGLIVFALFALVFRRRVPAFIVKYLSLAFMVALMGLMGLLILRDSWRSYKIHTCRQVEEAEKAEEVEKAEDGAANATSQDR